MNLLDSFDENKVKCRDCKKYFEKPASFTVYACSECFQKRWSQCIDEALEKRYKIK